VDSRGGRHSKLRSTAGGALARAWLSLGQDPGFAAGPRDRDQDWSDARHMTAEFIQTLAVPEQIPGIFTGEHLKGRKEPRIIMVGRSNVGKSSLINALLGTRLAQVSNHPGKTRAIHFYLWKEARKIVADLPGYGFAEASQVDRTKWAALIQAYLDADPIIEKALVLLDSRHGPTPKDIEAIQFLSGGRGPAGAADAPHGLPLSFIFTKSDQLKTQKVRAQRHKEAALALSELGYNPKQAHWISVKDGDGLKQLSASIVAPL
jgi:GTP-binding protein